MSIHIFAHPSTTVKGTVRVPGDKSISHRAVMLGALAQGVTEIQGFLEGEDALATLNAFRAMGVTIEGPEQERVCVHGVGMHGLKVPAAPLHLGNAGTAMRLMAGLLAGQCFDSTLIGDASLSSRPMARVVDPLLTMGANISCEEGGRPPLCISGESALHGISYTLPMASAQVQSCLLFAGLYAQGRTSITAPAIFRDHTQRMLQGFGYPVGVSEDGLTVSVEGGHTLTATSVDVPADISSAAFFLVAAAITPSSELTLQHVGINPTRTGVIDILQLMGADITLSNQSFAGGEPVADITIRYAPLKGVTIPQHLIAIAIDEFPILFIAAACAMGTTVLSGAKELRVKESDRLQAMADGLTTLGVKASIQEDGMHISAEGEKALFSGGVIDSHDDHRIAMAFAIASLRAKDTIRVDNCHNIATSFPNFVALANQVGLQLQEEHN